MRTRTMLVFVAAVLALAAPRAVQPPATIPDFGPLDAVAREELKRLQTPGAAIAVVIGDRVVYSRGVGVANVETNEPVRPEMLFRLGSTTKMFTATALVSLADRGAIDLNQPIGSYVRGLNAKLSQLTANQLLSHTSGFFDEAPMFGSNDETALENEVRSWTDARFFTEPGRIYSYSNPGYWLAGFLVQSTGGKLYADQMAATVFAPLGMTHTTLRPLVAMTFPLAQGHDETPDGPRVVRPAANNAASWPAGSIFSTVLDLSRFVIAFMNEGTIDGARVLSPNVIKAMTTPRTRIPGGDAWYGYGLELAKDRGVDVVRHGGSRSGYGSSIRMVPSRKFGVIAVANRSGIGMNATAERAMEIALALEPSAPPARRTPTSLTAEEIAALAGTYSQGPRTLEIVARDGKALLKQGTRETPLVKLGGDDLQTADGSRYVIVRGADGTIAYVFAGGRSWRKVTTS